MTIDLRTEALRGVAWRAAHSNIGIYAQAVHGEGGYEKRTERMEGWNECAIAHSKKYAAIRKWMGELPADSKTDIEDLLIRQVLDLHISDGKIEMSVNCNDLFFWGCADCEEIDVSELPSLKKALDDAATAGAESGGELLWVARKRAMRPQGAFYATFNEGLAKLFDECGEYRKAEIGNPVGSSFEEGQAYRQKRAR